MADFEDPITALKTFDNSIEQRINSSRFLLAKIRNTVQDATNVLITGRDDTVAVLQSNGCASIAVCALVQDKLQNTDLNVDFSQVCSS